MGEYPKRRKHKDNPYTISFCEKQNKYQVIFKDGKGIYQTIEVSAEIHNAFNSFELKDISELNEYDRHIEHSEVYDNSLNSRVVDKPVSLEELVENKITYEELYKVIEALPDIQKRRIKMYYFEDMTFDEIAKKEKCTKRAVKFSVDIGLEKIKEILKK